MPARTNTDALLTGGECAVESRKAKRFQLSAFVLFSWRRSDGTYQEAEGVTRDISMRGIFVLAANVPEMGANIELYAYLPALSEQGKVTKLHADGRILRVEQQGATGKGFAAEGFFQLDPPDTDLAPTALQ